MLRVFKYVCIIYIYTVLEDEDRNEVINFNTKMFCNSEFV